MEHDFFNRKNSDAYTLKTQRIFKGLQESYDKPYGNHLHEKIEINIQSKRNSLFNVGKLSKI